jgi:hypothetical protein
MGGSPPAVLARARCWAAAGLPQTARRRPSSTDAPRRRTARFSRPSHRGPEHCEEATCRGGGPGRPETRVSCPGLPHTSPTLASLGQHSAGRRDDLHTSDALTALTTDVAALKTGQQAIQKDLQELKALLQARPAAAAAPAAPSVVLSVEGAPFKGDKTAQLTLIAFTDFQ